MLPRANVVLRQSQLLDSERSWVKVSETRTMFEASMAPVEERQKGIAGGAKARDEKGFQAGFIEERKR